MGMLMNACQRIPGKMHMLELFLWTGFIFVIVFVMPRELQQRFGYPRAGSPIPEVSKQSPPCCLCLSSSQLSN